LCCLFILWFDGSTHFNVLIWPLYTCVMQAGKFNYCLHTDKECFVDSCVK
jgi:hypothetical protein